MVFCRPRRYTEKTTHKFDNRLVSALEPPIRFVPIVMGVFFATQHLALDGIGGTFLYKVNRSLAVFAIS
ncbi:MAG: hypothetical protein ACLFRG_05970 [Desulfococcaceae bacterium]